MIYIASDHAGYKLKEKLKLFLISNKIDYQDLGPDKEIAVDYPDYAKKVTKKVIESNRNKGILICGSGTGMCIAANRKKGIRAVLCYDEYSAIMSRKDNNANVLCLRARGVSHVRNLNILKKWISAKFSYAARHERRIEKLDI